jgi:hypothetical protein
MGLDSDPNPDLYATNNGCPDVFGADLTPDVVWATFGGIEIHVNPSPSTPPPPKGTFALSHNGDCTWQALTADFYFFYFFTGGDSVLQITLPTADYVFTSTVSGTAEQHFTNQASGPPYTYYSGGSGFVALSPDHLTLANRYSIMPDVSGKAELIHASDPNAQCRLVNPQDNSNLNILYDPTEL